MNNEQREHGARSSQTTPTPWDSQTVRGDRPRSRESNDRYRDSKGSREYHSQRDSKDVQRERVERYGSTASDVARSHGRNNSTGTGLGSSQGDYTESHTGRRHDYDVQAMETELNSPRSSMTRNPIPSPTVSVRSEYPTLTRSKQSQTLTCLITVEVPEGKWQPHPDDLRSAPPLPNVHHQEKEVVGPPQEDRSGWIMETPEELDEITEDLRMRVENWHGLDFTRYAQRHTHVSLRSNKRRFGGLRLHGTLRVSRDRASWQELECFLFAEMLICIKEKRGAQPLYADGNSKRKLTKCTLRGSILIKKHLKHVEPSDSKIHPYPRRSSN